MSDNFILITGCSGGGKSSLLNALGSKGFATVAEPGRRIVEEETAGSGRKLPWVDMGAFACRAVDMSRSDLATANSLHGPVFFDRGLIDASIALQFAGGDPYRKTLGSTLHYSKRVFLAPPWREIFTQDEERRHDFKSASQEFDRIEAALVDLGYDICVLPKEPVTVRVSIVLEKLQSA